MRVFVGVLLGCALLLPDRADAQRRGRYNPYSFAPYVGAYKDAFDLKADGSDLGYLVGFRAGYQSSDRLALNLNLGYAQADDIASRGTVPSPIYDNQWVLLTAGGDFALVPGNTSIALGADVGVGWRRTRANGPDNVIGRDPNDGWGSYELVAPGLTLQHRLSERVAFWIRGQDYILDFLENSAEHSPALSVGLSFR